MKINELIIVEAEAEEPDYAVQQDYKTFVPKLYNALVGTQAFGGTPPPIEQSVKYVKDPGRLPLIRTAGINSQQIQSAASSIGLTELPLTDIQSASSGQFTIHSFQDATGKIFTVVLAGRKKSVAGSLVLNRKDLTPTKLGLAEIFNNRAALAAKVKAVIPTKVADQGLAKACLELVDLAMARGQGQLTPESLEYIKPYRGMISQDFGEILAPLALASDEENINFPVGNEKLIDVTVGGKVRYSVKALGGSGTSMNSLGSLLDDYAATLTDQGKQKLFNDGIKIWQSTRKEGSVTDRICLAASKNAIPEYLSYVDILGGEFQSFSELKQLLGPKLKKLDYPRFLKMILPATQAGKWGINIGMPDDSNFYLGFTDKKPTPGQAGKRSYDHNPVEGAANIITYSLGKGMEFLIKRGPNQQRYKDIMNDMIRQLNCQLGHVDISDRGQLVITSKPFGNLEFEFDYHAPSHIAGNNRPGFMIVPPNKGKVKKSNIEVEKDNVINNQDSKKKDKPPVKPKEHGASLGADKITHPGRKTAPRALRFPEPKAGAGRKKR